MPLLANRPQLRFLLRAAALMVAGLLVWWLFLLQPLLGWIRVSGDFFLDMLPGATQGTHVTVKPDGDWLLQLPVPAEAAGRADLQPLVGGTLMAPRKVRSFKVQTSGNIVALFTLAMPLFLALMFNVRLPAKEMLRSLAIGCGIIAAIMPLVLALHGLFTIRAYFHLTSGPLVEFFWTSAGYLNTEVFPYLVPLFLAVWLNRALRAQIFAMLPVAADTAAPAVPIPISKKEKKRQRRHEA